MRPLFGSSVMQAQALVNPRFGAQRKKPEEKRSEVTSSPQGLSTVSKSVFQIDPLKAERPLGLRFPWMGRLLKRVLPVAWVQNYEVKHLPAPQLWINIVAHLNRALRAQETERFGALDDVNQRLAEGQKRLAYFQGELALFLHAKDNTPWLAAEPERAKRLCDGDPKSLSAEIRFQRNQIASIKAQLKALEEKKSRLQKQYGNRLGQLTESLRVLEEQYEKMTGQTLRNVRNEYRALLNLDERTPEEEAQFQRLAAEIWGDASQGETPESSAVGSTQNTGEHTWPWPYGMHPPFWF